MPEWCGGHRVPGVSRASECGRDGQGAALLSQFSHRLYRPLALKSSHVPRLQARFTSAGVSLIASRPRNVMHSFAREALMSSAMCNKLMPLHACINARSALTAFPQSARCVKSSALQVEPANSAAAPGCHRRQTTAAGPKYPAAARRIQTLRRAPSAPGTQTAARERAAARDDGMVGAGPLHLCAHGCSDEDIYRTADGFHHHQH